MKTNGSEVEWRIEQIACAILYRCFGHVTIEKTPDKGILDLQVQYNDGTGLRFGVVIKAYKRFHDNNRNRLIDQVAKVDLSQDRYRLPIILLLVDEPTETAKVAFLVGWRFGKPTIYKDFELRSLTQKNADTILQIIKSMDNVIRVLSTDNLFVRKRIIFSKNVSNNRVQQAEILYLRKLSSTYRMQQKEVVTEKETFSSLLKDTPAEQYPQDELDNMIFESVKAQFKNAKVKSKLLLLSCDLDDLQYYKDVHCHHTTLLVSPDFSELSTVALSMLDGLQLFSVNLDVFVENILYVNAFDNVSFDREEPLEGWIKKVTTWNQLKENMKPITEFFR